MTSSPTLLIDDDHGFSQSLIKRFQVEHIPLDWADTWEKGLELFRVGLHDLVIADYALPGSKMGLKLLATIKPLRPSSRLILISGQLLAAAADAIANTKLVDEYIVKTAELPDILVKLGRDAAAASASETNWAAVASAYLQSQDIFESEIESIDAIVQGLLK